MSDPLVQIDGEVNSPCEMTFEDFQQFAPEDQIKDISQFHPKRQGDGITLNALLNAVSPKETATYLTLHASADDFAASIPLEAVRDEGIVVYQLHGEPLTASQGGPIRFLIRNPAACHTDELDDCANVKFVDRIEFTNGRGRDTRPEDDEEHEELHRNQS
ncbi:MAG: hypothetical protein CMJ78_23155 [Planctomycetaceae bacterium]|nr:hypothetical protein [Planctomycetaceae bacterium]